MFNYFHKDFHVMIPIFIKYGSVVYIYIYNKKEIIYNIMIIFVSKNDYSNWLHNLI